jgi:dihydrofolate reductase
MRKIINSTYITLDGVIEKPHTWPSPGGFSQEGNAVQSELLLACDAVLMGRRTYDLFAPVWSTRSGDTLSDRMNSLPKYVVSSTLKDPEWNNSRVIGGDLVAEITRLKQEPGQDIVQYGFGSVSHALLSHGLLDELRLWVHPVLVRRGGPADLLYRDGSLASFQLIGTKSLPSGTVILSYRFEKTEG